MKHQSLHTFLQALGFKATSTPNEYLASECWKCGGQDKLYFNTQKLVGFCQKCSRPVFLKDLLKESGLDLTSKDLVDKLDELQRSMDMADQGFKDAVLSRLMNDVPAPSGVNPLPEVAFPDEFQTLKEGQHSVTGRKALAYLEGRGFKRRVLFDLGFGYCATGYYGGRVIVPFIEDEKVVYWQARDFTNTQPTSSKILNPPKWQVPTGKSEVLFNYDGARNLDLIIITESWGSALAVGSYAVGLNGSSMSETQFLKLKQAKCDGFIVLLDHGKEAEAWNIAKSLASLRYTCVAQLPYGDPNEVPRSLLLKAIGSCTPYSSTSHALSLSKILA